ncbi:MAG: SIMPL domain-containing protein [Pseudomonadota bacterium]
MSIKFILAGLFALIPLAVQGAELPAYPFIHVSGSGMSYVMPDIGDIDFEISAHNDDPAVATALVATRVAEVRALMRENGVADGDLEVRDVRKDIVKNDAPTPLYEIKCGVKVTVRNLAKWEAIVAPLLDKPNLQSFMTVFDTSDRPKVEMALMADAIRSARLKGEGIAAGFGRKLGAVGGASIGELKNLTRAMNLAPSDVRQRGGDQEGPDRAGLLKVNLLRMGQSIEVIFKIK